MNPESNESLSRRVAEAAGESEKYNDMTNQEISRVVAKAAGHTLADYCDADFLATGCHNYAYSIDAIAALEREAGLRVDVMWTGHSGDCTALAFRDGTSDLVARRSADTEPRARCLAYLAWASEEGRG